MYELLLIRMTALSRYAQTKWTHLLSRLLHISIVSFHVRVRYEVVLLNLTAD